MKALSSKDIGLEQALAVVNAAIDKSKEIGTKMDIAVVDAGRLSSAQWRTEKTG